MLTTLATDNRPPLIDVGNSGTTLYLTTALAAHRAGGVCFDGDASIRRRSAGPLLKALHALGVVVTAPESTPRAITPPENAPPNNLPKIPEHAPYCVRGPFRPGQQITVASPTSQFLSALLLAAPLIPGDRSGNSATTISVSLLNERPYVDMTCWWLDQQEIAYERDGYERFVIPSGATYRPFDTTLPGDYSSATFWFAAAAITTSGVTVQGLDATDLQGDRAVLDILKTLGCEVTWSDSPAVTVRGPIRTGGRFDLNAIPDALPALAVVACYAPQSVTLYNVPQARDKETDRIAVMARELGRLGGRVRELSDGLEIQPSRITGGAVDSHGDHRVAMALACAALGAEQPVHITDAAAADVTYPAFFSDLALLAPAAFNSEER